MEIIYKGRGLGKTIELIKRSAETGEYIVCHDSNEASRIFRVAQEMDLKIPLPLTYNEFLDEEYYSRGIKGFLIDNVEMLLQHISRIPVNVITLTKEEENKRYDEVS